MSVSYGWLVLVAVLALLGLYLRGLVGRLDRLHLRVEAAREALDAQLLRRAGSALDLAQSGVLDPASSVLLVDGAIRARDAEPDERESAESALSQDLRAVLEAPDALDHAMGAGGDDLIVALAAACDRVVMARRFYNDAVQATVSLRKRLLVRTLRLSGRASLPVSFEMDDAPPPSLSGGVAQRP